MAKRTGLWTINEVAKRLCGLVTAFSPIIRKAYPENDNLQLALDGALAACALLVDEAEAQLPVGV